MIMALTMLSRKSLNASRRSSVAGRDDADGTLAPTLLAAVLRQHSESNNLHTVWFLTISIKLRCFVMLERTTIVSCSVSRPCHLRLRRRLKKAS